MSSLEFSLTCENGSSRLVRRELDELDDAKLSLLNFLSLFSPKVAAIQWGGGGGSSRIFYYSGISRSSSVQKSHFYPTSSDLRG